MIEKNISCRTTAIRIVVAAALAILVLAATGATSLSTIQQQGHAITQTKQQEQSMKQNIIQSLHGNLDKRSAVRQQHADQENQCLRAGKCSNAGLGESALGNDNSITGFADQSKNVQRTVVTPTLSHLV